MVIILRDLRLEIYYTLMVYWNWYSLRASPQIDVIINKIQTHNWCTILNVRRISDDVPLLYVIHQYPRKEFLLWKPWSFRIHSWIFTSIIVSLERCTQFFFHCRRKFTNMNFSKNFNSSMRENVVLGRYPCEYISMFIIPSMIDASNKYETKMYLLSSYCMQRLYK